MGRLTAAQAIGNECRSCQPGQRMTPEKCGTAACKLSPNVFTCRSSVKRVAAHCRDCNGEDHPRECTGRLLDGQTCILHPFRLGKNPYRPKQGAKSRAVSEKGLAAAARTRFAAQERRSPSGQ